MCHSTHLVPRADVRCEAQIFTILMPPPQQVAGSLGEGALQGPGPGLSPEHVVLCHSFPQKRPLLPQVP